MGWVIRHEKNPLLALKSSRAEQIFSLDLNPIPKGKKHLTKVGKESPK